MTRTVFCKKYQKDLEGLDRPPFPTAKGKELYENVSKQAWQEWQKYQTMLINEKQLSMMDPAARKYLQEQQDNFFANKEIDEIEGYVAPEK